MKWCGSFFSTLPKKCIWWNCEAFTRLSRRGQPWVTLFNSFHFASFGIIPILPWTSSTFVIITTENTLIFRRSTGRISILISMRAIAAHETCVCSGVLRLHSKQNKQLLERIPPLQAIRRIDSQVTLLHLMNMLAGCCCILVMSIPKRDESLVLALWIEQ